MCVQAFRSKFTIERLDEGVVSGFSRTGDVQDNAVLVPEEGVAGAARVFLLQPNFFGLGINFNEIIERFSRPKKDKTLAIEHQETEDKVL